MDWIVDSPFLPVLATCVAAAVALGAAARVSGSRHVATLAAPVVFLVSYVVTYQKIPPFPPLGAANKVFYVALAATLGASAFEAFSRVPRWALAGLASLLAAGWVGWSKLANPDLPSLALFPALVVVGGLALWGLDRLATPRRRPAAALWRSGVLRRFPRSRRRRCSLAGRRPAWASASA